MQVAIRELKSGLSRILALAQGGDQGDFAQQADRPHRRRSAAG